MQARRLPLACCYALILHKVGRSTGRDTRQKVLRTSYIYYLSRSIDLRLHWPPLRWHLWRQWSMLHPAAAVAASSHQPAGELWSLRRRILAAIPQRLPGVDKARFERAMQGLFD